MTMPIQSLQDLFEHELEDLNSAEKQIIEALPDMIEEASDENLKKALEKHLEITETQLERLQTIAEENDIKLNGHECKGMKGILDEGKMALKAIDDPATKDAAIIASAQRVEHYEIAAYGTAQTYAEELELDDAAETLEQTLEEEYTADEKLTELAVGEVNEEAIDLADDGSDDE